MLLKLTYLDIPGAAESTRLALRWGNIPFDDVRVSYDEVAALRKAGKLPCGQVPTLEVISGPHQSNRKIYGQSGACLRFAGQLVGLYPSDLILDIEQIMGCIQDIKTAMGPVWYGSALPRNPTTGKVFEGVSLDDKQVSAVVVALNTVLIPARLEQLEKILASKSTASDKATFCFGKRLTIADIELLTFVRGVQDGSFCQALKPSIVDKGKYPRLMAVVEAVKTELQTKSNAQILLHTQQSRMPGPNAPFFPVQMRWPMYVNAPFFPVQMRRPMNVGFVAGNVPTGPGLLGKPSLVKRNNDSVGMRGPDKKKRKQRSCAICRARKSSDTVAKECPGRLDRSKCPNFVSNPPTVPRNP
ncbi:MAG: hypothetical protein SGILL_009478 [Bacillariaceae sp.]